MLLLRARAGSPSRSPAGAPAFPAPCRETASMYRSQATAQVSPARSLLAISDLDMTGKVAGLSPRLASLSHICATTETPLFPSLRSLTCAGGNTCSSASLPWWHAQRPTGRHQAGSRIAVSPVTGSPVSIRAGVLTGLQKNRGVSRSPGMRRCTRIRRPSQATMPIHWYTPICHRVPNSRQPLVPGPMAWQNYHKIQLDIKCLFATNTT